MGTKHSHQSEQTVKNINKIKTNIKADRIQQIEHAQVRIASQTSIRACGSTSNDWESILPTTLDVAKIQMGRGGAPLTKPDLISIIIALDPQQSSRLYQLNMLKIADLNIIIRSIIYDVRRYSSASATESSSATESLKSEPQHAQLVSISENIEHEPSTDITLPVYIDTTANNNIPSAPHMDIVKY